MIAPTIKAKILVFAIFFVGIGTGVLLSNFYATRVTSSADADVAASSEREERTQRAERDINSFYDYLELDPAQREEMTRIGEETQREFRELRKETSPRYEALQEASRAKIRAVLTVEQLAKYDEFRRKMDEGRRNRNRDRDPSKNNRDSNKDHGQRPN